MAGSNFRAEEIEEEKDQKEQEYFFGQEKLDVCMNRVYDRFMEANVPELALNEIMTEWKGGRCQVCGKDYEEYTVKNRYADFVYWRPVCKCEADIRGAADQEDDILGKLKIAEVPSIYLRSSFANWDKGVDDKTNEAFQEVCEYVRDRDFRNTGLVLYGTVGTGKTRCAVSVLREIAKTSWSFAFRLMSDVIAGLEDRQKSGTVAGQILSHKVVLFDDLDKATGQSRWMKERLFRVLDKMISAEKIILATANFVEDGEFVERLGDANTSRLVAGCRFIRFEGGDYRTRTKKGE